jgi:hypothetical protein
MAQHVASASSVVQMQAAFEGQAQHSTGQLDRGANCTQHACDGVASSVPQGNTTHAQAANPASEAIFEQFPTYPQCCVVRIRGQQAHSHLGPSEALHLGLTRGPPALQLVGANACRGPAAAAAAEHTSHSNPLCIALLTIVLLR